MVALAGVLAMQPQVILVDEATAGLDPGCAVRSLRSSTGWLCRVSP